MIRDVKNLKKLCMEALNEKVKNTLQLKLKNIKNDFLKML